MLYSRLFARGLRLGMVGLLVAVCMVLVACSDGPGKMPVSKPDTAGNLAGVAVDNKVHIALLWKDQPPQLQFLDLDTDQAEELAIPERVSAVVLDEPRSTALLVDSANRLSYLSLTEREISGEQLQLEHPVLAAVIDPDRRLALLAGPQGELSILDVDTRSVRSASPLAGTIMGMSLRTDTGEAFIAYRPKAAPEDAPDRLAIFSLATGEHVNEQDLPGQASDLLAVPGLGILVLALEDSLRLQVLSLPDLIPIFDAPLQDRPSRLLLQPETRTAVVLSESGNRLGLLDLFTMSFDESFTEPEQPRTGAIGTRHNQAFLIAGTSGKLQRIRLPSPTPLLHTTQPDTLRLDGEPIALVLHGQRFIDGAVAEVNGERLPARWLGPTELKTELPFELLQSDTAAEIRVINPDPSAGASDSLILPIEGIAPRIDGISPGEGPGGSVISIHGNGFSPQPGGNMVSIGGVKATVSSASVSRLRIVVPLETPGGVVTVQTAHGLAQADAPFQVRARQEYELELSAQAIQLPWSGQGSIVVDLTSTGLDDYDYPVALRIQGLPEGIKADLSHERLSRQRSVRITFSGSADPGTYELTLLAEGESDAGKIEHSVAFKLSVLSPETTSVYGRVLHAEDNRPLAGVKITLGDATTLTDGAGEYLFVDPPLHGDQVVIIDGDAINTDTHHYPSLIPMPVMIEKHQANKVMTTFLAPVDIAVFTEITPGKAASVKRADIPGYELRIPEGVGMTGWDGKPIDRINVRMVQPDRLPIRPIPDGVNTNSVYLYYFYRPGGAEPDEPIPVSMRNDLGLEPGDQALLWYYDESPTADPNSNQWRVMGTGSVSADGLSIVSDPGVGIPRFCCGASFASPPEQPDNPPGGDGDYCSSAGNPVDLASGAGTVLGDHDLRVGGDLPLGIGIRYNTLSNREGPFGRGTFADYEWRLTISGQQATVIKPDGIRYNLIRGEDGVYRQLSGRIGGYGMEAWQDGADAMLRLSDGRQMRFGVGIPFNGLLLAVLDSSGREQIRYTRQEVRSSPANGRVTTIADVQGRRYRLSYASNLRVGAITDPLGREQRFEYSGSNLIRVTDFAGQQTEYTWGTRFGRDQIVKKSTAGNAVTLYDYTAPPAEPVAPPGASDWLSTTPVHGRVAKQQLPDGGIFQFDYRPLARNRPTETEVTHPEGARSRHFFNGLGYETRREDALGRVWERSYDRASNLLQRKTDPLGRVTRYTYDAQGNVNSIRDPADNVTLIDHHPRYNKPTRIRDPLGREVQYGYDSQGQVIHVINNAGERYDLSRDERGRIVSITDPLGQAVHMSYDDYGNITSLTDPLGNSQRREYDLAGRLLRITDPLGRSTQYRYDVLDRPIEIENASGTIAIGYTAGGRVETVRDPKGGTIETNAYDGRGRLVSRTDALGGKYSFSYDLEGNLIRLVDARGLEASFEYDALNRLVRMQDADARTITYSYDHAGRLIRVRDSEAGEYRYGYDALDRLVREVSERGLIEYSYDAASQLIERRVNEVEVTRYQYDAAGRVSRIEHNGRAVDYSYDGAGRLTEKRLPNGMRQHYDWDSASRLLAIRYSTPGGLELDRIDYEYDASGARILRRHEAGRAVLETPFEAEYDAANRLIAFNGQALHYDENGNLTRRDTPDGAIRYQWDARNQLIAIDGPEHTARFQYDYLGRRIQREINGVTTRYLYHGPQAVAELDASDALQSMYHTGVLLDEVLARYSRTQDRVLLTDALQSVIALADNDGWITTRYDYSPYGETRMEGLDEHNSLQYTGREHDGHGLYYYRARYYDPQLKRFLSPDPIGLLGGGVNYYAYVEGSPVNLADPFGLWSLSFDAYVGIGGGITIGKSEENGRWFSYARIGIGFGVGGGADELDQGPAGRGRMKNPYGKPCVSSIIPMTGTSVGTSFNVGVALGPHGVVLDGYAGYNLDGTQTLYRKDPSLRSTNNPFVGRKIFTIGGSAGVEVGGWY